MMKKSLILLALVLTVFSQIPFDRSKRIPTYPCYKNDLVEYDLTKIFDNWGNNIDWSKVTFTASQKIQGGDSAEINNHIGVPFSQPYLKVPAGFDDSGTINRVIRLSDRRFVAIVNYSTIVMYHTTPNGFNTTSHANQTYAWNTTLSLPRNYACEDVVHHFNKSSNGNSIVVGCARYGVFTVTPMPKFFVLNALTGAVDYTYNHTGDSNVQIFNELRMFMFYHGTNKTYHLVFYDKEYNTNTTRNITGNYSVGLLTYLNNELVDEAAAQITFPNANNNNVTQVFDFYSVENSIYMTGLRGGNTSFISISGCSLTQNMDFDCSPSYLTNVKANGGSMIVSNKALVGYNTDTSMMDFYVFANLTVGPDFIFAVEHMNLTGFWPPASENYTIRDLDLSPKGFVVHFGKFRNTFDSAIGIGTWLLSDPQRFTLLENKTGTVLNQNVWTFRSVAGSLTAFRIGDPFFWAYGSLFPENSTNTLTINATYNNETVSATGRIYSLHNNTQNTPTQFIWSKPYTEVYSNSNLMIPFFFSDYYSGNNIGWGIKYDQTNPLKDFFNDSVIFTEFEPQLHLFTPPIMQQYNMRRLIGANGVAIAQTESGDVYMYSCEHNDHLRTPCVQKGMFAADRINNQTVQSDLIYDSGDLMFWSTNGTESNLISFSFNGELNIFKLNQGVHDVKFVVNAASATNDIYIATLTKTTHYVNVYRTTMRSFNMIAQIASITKDTVALNEFCPTRIQQDPYRSKFHIMSACHSFNDTTNGLDVIVGVVVEEFLFGIPFVFMENSVVINAEGSPFSGNPLHCPFVDHYVVSDKHNRDFLFAVDTTTTFAKYHKYIGNLGFSEVDRMDCFGVEQMYALYGMGGNGTAISGNIYGVFYAMHKSDPLKFVTYIDNTIERDFTYYDTYSVGPFIWRVQYPARGEQDLLKFAAVVNRPPLAFTFVKNAGPSFNNQTINYTITAAQRDLPGAVRTNTTGNVTLIVYNGKIKFHNVSVWQPSMTGYQPLNKFVNVTGPLRYARALGEVDGVTFRGRSYSVGQMRSRTSTMNFNQFRGSPSRGVGLSFFNDVSIFDWVEGAIIVAQRSFNDVVSFDQATIPGSNATIVFYSGKYTQDAGYLSCFVFMKNREFDCIDPQFGDYADKIRVVQYNASEYMVFALNWRSQILTCYGVHLNSSNTGVTNDTIRISRRISNVIDFDATNTTAGIDLFATLDSSSSITHARFTQQNPGDPWEINQLVSHFQANPAQPHYLWAIAAANSPDGTTNYVVVNTAGTNLYTFDMVVNSAGPQNETMTNWSQKGKFVNFDGGQLFVNKDYVIQRAFSFSGERDTSVFFWKRDQTTTIFTSIDLSLMQVTNIENTHRHDRRVESVGQRPQGFYVNYPISLYSNAAGDTFLATGSDHPMFPLIYYTVGPMSVNITGTHHISDFKNLRIFFESTPKEETSLTVSELLNGGRPLPPPPTSSTSSPTTSSPTTSSPTTSSPTTSSPTTSSPTTSSPTTSSPTTSSPTTSSPTTSSPTTSSPTTSSPTTSSPTTSSPTTSSPVPTTSSSVTSGSPTAKTLEAWPFIVIIVVLILISVAWFAYTATKQNAQNDAEFFSIEPESKARDANDEEEGLEDNVGLAYAKADDDEDEDLDDEDDEDERLG